ncbi:TPA: hypothetical protein DCX15_06570 [bacterium]|nr:hypothetical protein [bacterium]
MLKEISKSLNRCITNNLRSLLILTDIGHLIENGRVGKDSYRLFFRLNEAVIFKSSGYSRSGCIGVLLAVSWVLKLLLDVEQYPSQDLKTLEVSAQVFNRVYQLLVPIRILKEIQNDMRKGGSKSILDLPQEKLAFWLASSVIQEFESEEEKEDVKQWN